MTISNVGTWMNEIGTTWLMATMPTSDLYIALRYDHDQHVKQSVAHAIGTIGRTESIEHLARTIMASDNSGTDDILIISCIEAIGEIGRQEGFDILLEILRGDYRQIVKLAARESLKKIPW